MAHCTCSRDAGKTCLEIALPAVRRPFRAPSTPLPCRFPSASTLQQNTGRAWVLFLPALSHCCKARTSLLPRIDAPSAVAHIPSPAQPNQNLSRVDRQLRSLWLSAPAGTHSWLDFSPHSVQPQLKAGYSSDLPACKVSVHRLTSWGELAD